MSIIRYSFFFFIFVAMQVQSAEGGAAGSDFEHIKSGAHLGINMSASKEELVYQTLVQLEISPKSYCLFIGRNLAGDELLSKLEVAGHSANVCDGDFAVKVEFSGFKEMAPG